MTRRRVVALAQALTMIILLAPGPLLVGPPAARAAPAPVPDAPDVVDVFDAEGKGVGCAASKYRGPKLPKNPPWPPGARPTPSPTPAPSPDASLDPTAEEPEPSDQPTAGAATALVSASGARLAQADPTPSPSPASTAGPVGPAPEPTPRVRKKRLLRGIDVSRWQNAVDYDVVKDAGNRFVIMKATESTELVDPWYETNLAAARAQGLTVGAYHVFDYTIDGTLQADHFIDRLEQVGGIDGALPPVVDVECWSYRGRSVHAISATRLRDLVDRIYERIGRMPMIYTSVYMWSQVVGNAEGFEDTPLWAACWRCDAPPSIPPGWDTWDFWQIGTFRIPGAAPDAASPDRIDGNYFRGKNQDLKALRLRPFTIAEGAVASKGGTVRLDLGGRDARSIRTSPDGETWGEWRPVRGTPTARIPSEEGEHTVYVQLRNGPDLRSPVLSDTVLVDRTPPEADAPTVVLREGAIDLATGLVPVAVRWQASDLVAGLTDGAVVVACGEDRNRRLEAPASAEPATTVDLGGAAQLFTDAACEVTAVTADGVGNRTRTTADGIRASFMTPADGDIVAGDQVGVVARRGPDLGRAAVSIDGQALGLVDLYAPEPSGPEVVYVADLAGPATVTLEPTGTSDPAATGTAIALEGFVSLDVPG